MLRTHRINKIDPKNLHCKPIPCNENRVFPVKFSHREIPVMKTGVPAIRTGVPCNEKGVFPCVENFTGKTLFWPCTGPVQDCSVGICKTCK
jgi:hypothetical protein